MDPEQESLDAVSRLFEKMGAQPRQAEVMASQLLKRATQIAEAKNISLVEATGSLVEQVLRARESTGGTSNSDVGPVAGR